MKEIFVLESSSTERPFEITGRRQEKSGVIHPLECVVKAYHAWMEEQGESGHVLSCEERGTCYRLCGQAPEGRLYPQFEAGFYLHGAVNSAFPAEFADQEVLQLILSLAAFIAKRLHQTSAYVVFAGMRHKVRVKGSPPTED